MNFESLKEYENLKEQWHDYEGQGIEEEAKLREKFQRQFAKYSEMAKTEFLKVFEGKGFDINATTLFITASYGEFKIQLKVGEPNTSTKYEFELAVLKDSRRMEHRIVIMPREDFHYPKFSTVRELPRLKDHIKKDIQKICDDILLMKEIQKSIETSPFYYAYYRVDNHSPNYKEMKKYLSFTELLENLLSEYS